MNKNQAFSYLINKMIEWHKECSQDEDYAKKFTKLFLLKMLFLIAAIKTREDEDLLDTFDNFYALPYGPVESDIYDNMSNDEIPIYSITDRGLSEKRVENIWELEADEKEKLNESLRKVRERNENLITKSAFELVEITHKWECWNKAFKFAKFTGSGSAKMSKELIRGEKISYFGN